MAGEPPRRPVSGTVTVDWKPMTSGVVLFRPANGHGAATVALVRDGRYFVPGHDGLVPGTYEVGVFSAVNGVRRSVEFEADSLIPTQGTGRADLRRPEGVSQSVVEVKDRSENVFNFDMRSATTTGP
jgi:hypothetical protein